MLHCTTIADVRVSCTHRHACCHRDTRDIAADVRKAEVFINNRGSAAQTDADGTEHFIGWENYRWGANTEPVQLSFVALPKQDWVASPSFQPTVLSHTISSTLAGDYCK